MELEYLSYDDLWVLFVTANRHYQDYTQLHIKYSVSENFEQLSHINVLLDELKSRRQKGERLYQGQESVLTDAKS